MYPLGSERGHNRIGMWGIIHENLFFYIFNEKFVKILWKQDCDVRCAKFFSKIEMDLLCQVWATKLI